MRFYLRRLIYYYKVTTILLMEIVVFLHTCESRTILGLIFYELVVIRGTMRKPELASLLVVTFSLLVITSKEFEAERMIILLVSINRNKVLYRSKHYF